MGEEGWEVGEVKVKEGVIERNVTPNSQHLVSDPWVTCYSSR